jgi:hypothetical protein
MKHDLEHLTDADIAAALESLYVPGDHKERLHKEAARRAKVADWDLVGGAFEDGMEECHTCGYWFYQYWTDTGAEQTCDLLDRDGGEPWLCPAYDRLKNENEDGAPK